MRLKSSLLLDGSVCHAKSFSFVADTLKTVGRDMRSKDVVEDDLEDHVSLYNLSSTSFAQNFPAVGSLVLLPPVHSRQYRARHGEAIAFLRDSLGLLRICHFSSFQIRFVV